MRISHEARYRDLGVFAPRPEPSGASYTIGRVKPEFCLTVMSY